MGHNLFSQPSVQYMCHHFCNFYTHRTMIICVGSQIFYCTKCQYPTRHSVSVTMVNIFQQSSIDNRNTVNKLRPDYIYSIIKRNVEEQKNVEQM